MPTGIHVSLSLSAPSYQITCLLVISVKGKGKDKGHPTTGHEGPEGD
jgi:hypothetical protein